MAKLNIDRTSVKLMSHLRKMTKLTKSKSDKNNCRIKSKPHAHLQTIEKKDVQSSVKIGMKLYKELHLHGTRCLYTFIESEVKKWQSSQSRKSDKN